jgi:hypothetical protein
MFATINMADLISIRYIFVNTFSIRRAKIVILTKTNFILQD